MGQNPEESPTRRPKSAPGLIRDNMEGAGSPYKTSTPLALYASLSRAGHFQGIFVFCFIDLSQVYFVNLKELGQGQIDLLQMVK